MSFADLISVTQWWFTIFIIGVVFIPLTNLLFSNFFDKGYIFSKIIGITIITYAMFVLGTLKIIPYELTWIFVVIGVCLITNIVILLKFKISDFKQNIPILLLEECLFFLVLLFWSFIHAHQPDINGLEKFMDFGFINSILRTKYFPPLDMWFTPFSINYYYFGHLMTATLTKLSNLPSPITFNLMLAVIPAFGFVSAFSIIANLLQSKYKKGGALIPIVGGLLSAFILNFAGNLHTIYLFFKPYENEKPIAFWNLIFSPNTFPNSYWYPNATRFIHNTIHEFPIYSNVVSDLHGHFLGIPLVLLTVAILLSLFLKNKKEDINWKIQIPIISFLLAAMYMTNAWDGIIYFLLAAVIIFYLKINSRIIFYSKSLKQFLSNFWMQRNQIIEIVIYWIAILIGFFIFSLPFNIHFKPFASGIGLLCSPKFLTDIGKLGPFIFDVDHCQHSPLWQLIILYGFFYFWVIAFGIYLFTIIKSKLTQITKADVFIGILISVSTLLIIIPEVVYVKDIYPAHYRANTMFKLVYQAFILLSLSCGYIIVRLAYSKLSFIKYRLLKLCFSITGAGVIILVFLYPYYAINSYFGDLKNYRGLEGTNYLKTTHPEDYILIKWINEHITESQSVILEAQGDSYTDYGRISVNTGLPTILGWTVHEWLWRGTYDIPAPRIQEVERIYKSSDINETKTLLKKYDVKFVVIGELERQKYQELDEDKFKILGRIIYQTGNTKLFVIN
jgi:YYY domain-containing protein